MVYLICYDIESDRIRQRIGNKLIDWGLERIQYSVFIGEWSETRKKQFDLWLLEKVKMDGKFDILQLPLSQYSVTAAKHWGTNPPDWEYLQGKKLSLIL